MKDIFQKTLVIIRNITGQAIAVLKRPFKKKSSPHAVHNYGYRSSHSSVSSRGRHRMSKRRRSFKIKNKRRLITAAALFIAVITALVLIFTLPGVQPQIASAQNEASKTSSPTATPIAATLVVPVYSTISISKGINASVVSDIQVRLMELGYLDEDEPDGVFGELTVTAITHFQTQHELTADGIVSEETYALLFSDDAKYYTLTIGAEDTDVYELQERLCELGYMSEATGHFGEDTEAAVLKFQKMNKLTEDGKIGKETREMLYSSDAVANAYSYGEKSDEILSYQKKLKTLGYLTTEPDGVFGADTKAAVKRFQEANGLIADGWIGPLTATALSSDDAAGNALTIGAEGTDVENVQKRLKKLGYMSKVTGYFGSITDSAVRSFQHNNGLKVDGKVGRATMNKLFSDKAKKSTGVNITGSNVDSFISVAKV